ncbi:unnamed protein product [Spirodela intermedia]|uniref:Uncharacterized protein n=1 Tax=Spirodela intermedia TaxID=51605 RepID=A0A7I8J7P8_SPIIN|nr:unnamed protein product [Spirodela intermedia]CAA6666109.1 unnamed protein product [Spirodela intermedia]
MDLLPTEAPLIAQRHGFRSLKLINVGMDEPLAESPFGVHYGPRMRAALALAVKVGSVLEEEEERGVAHIVEHLAFSATKKYSNHDIVKFLESIGAEFGACQNALTSSDETIFELLVPVDKPELLSLAISVLAEFSSEVRASADDLEKERGAVLEEYRGGGMPWVGCKTLTGFFCFKYAERLPIGLEKVIRTVTAETVRQFYQKWYHLHNMAVICVGDFEDPQAVVDLIKVHFGQKLSLHSSPPVLPDFPVPSHDEPRFSCFVESEAAGSAVMISCKIPAAEMRTVKDYRNSLAEAMFHCALNQRFFKISRRKDPPSSVKAYIMTSSCREGGTVGALEFMLMEVARVRLHGFSEREIAVVRALMMSEIESAYLERDQMQSTNLRDEYLQHFFRKEPVVGIEYEAQLQKSILPHISAEEVSKFAVNFSTSCSCVIKIVEHRARATLDDLKASVSKVNTLEGKRGIPPWDDEHVPRKLFIVQQSEFPNIGATELTLSNGIKICYKCTDFLDDQVVFTGFSYGGLSELSESDYVSCSMGPTIAGEIGVFGYKPSVLMDMLAGKRAEVGTKVGAYMRTFYGDCSPSDLETALQLVYQLFTTSVKPGNEEVKIVMQMTEEAILAQERDPYTAFANRVRELNYGNSYFFRPIRICDLKKVDPIKACEYFNNCFKDPSNFTVVLVGNIHTETALPLILQYLGGIPKPSKPILHCNRDELKGLPFTFPAKVIREVVRSPMVEEQCSVQLAFPVLLNNSSMFEGVFLYSLPDFCSFFFQDGGNSLRWILSKILETKIMQVLRFKHGQIYSVGVSVFLGGNKPSRTGDVRGDISVNFSCDPAISWKLVDLALDEILHIQERGTSDQDVLSVLEIEQRAHENGLQENYYWMDRILRSYQSRSYFGDVSASFQVQDEGRTKVRESLTPATAQSALRRILPFPCKNQYTVVVLVLAGAAGAAVLAITLWRHLRRSPAGSPQQPLPTDPPQNGPMPNSSPSPSNQTTSNKYTPD